MNCDQHEDAIGDFMDGSIEPGVAEALAAHLADCVSCRALTDDLRAIRSAALTLERQVPPARTWPRIAAAVEQQRRSRGFGWWSWRPLAVAAVVVLMSSATWLMLGPASPGASSGTSSPDFDLPATEAHYQMAIAGLEQITDAGGMELDPMTAEILKVNLTVIDMAIGESRAALETEPSNDVAQQSLFAALSSKVSLLQDTVALINETRQGQNP